MAIRNHADRDQAAGSVEVLLTEPGTPTPVVDFEAFPPPKYLAGIQIFEGTDDLIMKTIERTMNAETPEALLSDPESGGLRDYTGSMLTITSVLGIMPSTIREGSYYIIFDAIVAKTGELVTLSTGSPYAASRIAQLAAKGWLPRRVNVVQLASASHPGQASLWITDAQPVPAEGETEPF